jgi:hypothetical protein
MRSDARQDTPQQMSPEATLGDVCAAGAREARGTMTRRYGPPPGSTAPDPGKDSTTAGRSLRADEESVERMIRRGH